MPRPLLLALVLAGSTACFTASDDEGTDDIATDATAGETETSTTGDTTESTTDESTTTSTDTTESTTESITETSTDTDTTDTTTGGGALCGWQPDSMFYTCGGMGEDPSLMHPYTCPVMPELVNGAPCTDTNLTFEGCCDANGDVWYCQDGVVIYTDCQ